VPQFRDGVTSNVVAYDKPVSRTNDQTIMYHPRLSTFQRVWLYTVSYRPAANGSRPYSRRNQDSTLVTLQNRNDSWCSESTNFCAFQ